MHGRTGIPRERLSTLLWPESDEGSARGSLKQAVFVIRRDLGAGVVQGTAELRCGAGFPSSDLADVEAALQQGDLEQAVAAYQGPFLDGFHLSGASQEFERWVDGERDRLAQRRATALETLASRAEASGDHHAALRWWRELCDALPLDSRCALGVMRARLALGDRAGGLQFAETHRALLKAELGLSPDAEFEQLVAALRTTRPTAVTEVALLPRSLVPDPAVAAMPAADGPVVALGRARRSWRRGTVLAGAALGLSALSVLGASLRERHPSVDPRRVAIVATGTSGRDGPVPDGSRALREAVAHHLTTLQLTPIVVESLAGRGLAAAARRVGAAYIVSVELEPVGAVGAITSMTGERLWGLRATSGDRTVADRFAERVAIAVAVRADPAMAGWIHRTTEPSSIAAYRDFSHGLTLFADNESPTIEVLLRAAQRDTAFTFSLVLAGLQSVYEGRLPVADSIAMVLRHRDLPPLERGIMDVQAAVMSMNLDAEYRGALAVAAAAPASEWSYLLADAALKLGRGAEAARVAEEMGVDRGWLKGSVIGWGLLGRALHHMGDRDRELAAMAEAFSNFPTNRIVAQLYLKALAARGDVDSVLAEVDRVLALRQRGNWGDHQPVSSTIAEFWAHGHREGARRLALRAIDWLQHQDAATREEWAVMVPTYLYQAGDLNGAGNQLRELAARGPLDTDNLQLLGVIAAEQGDRETAERIAAELPGGPSPSARIEMLVVRAGILASLGQRDLAVDLLRDACRAGFAWRTVLHVLPGFDHLAGFRPFEDLVHATH
ncbi:MAG: BTAD domain-containing putative transcriptional regulator [Gemmatimonadaceae bacterium]